MTAAAIIRFYLEQFKMFLLYYLSPISSHLYAWSVLPLLRTTVLHDKMQTSFLFRGKII